MGATRHGGHVPIHGRLFAQWMHFAFPLECPYPQVIERNGALNPSPKPPRWAYVSQQEKNAALQIESTPIELAFLAQWSDEEVFPLEDESTTNGSSVFGSHARDVLRLVVLAVMVKLLLSSARSGT